MSNRVINRRGARELTAEEMDRIAAGTGTGFCLLTFCNIPPHPPSDDTTCSDTDS